MKPARRVAETATPVLNQPEIRGLLTVWIGGRLVFPQGLPAVGAGGFEGPVGVEDDLLAPPDVQQVVPLVTGNGRSRAVAHRH